MQINRVSKNIRPLQEKIAYLLITSFVLSDGLYGMTGLIHHRTPLGSIAHHDFRLSWIFFPIGGALNIWAILIAYHIWRYSLPPQRTRQAAFLISLLVLTILTVYFGFGFEPDLPSDGYIG